MGFERVARRPRDARAPRCGCARGEAPALEGLPVEAACSDEPLAFLHGIGIRTVGELMRLPREGLAQRCGRRLLDDLDRALGSAAGAARVLRAAARASARSSSCPAPVAHAEGLLFAARRLLVQLEGLLAARQAGIRAFTLVLLRRGSESHVEVRPRCAGARRRAPGAAAAREACHAAARAAGRGDPPRGRRFRPAARAQRAACSAMRAAEAEDWVRLVERLRARLGHAAVYGLATQPDHRPEHAWRRVEPGEWDPREFRQPGPAAAVAARARETRGRRIRAAGGARAHRIGLVGRRRGEPRLLHRAPAEASLGWIYREAGEWFLHGFFA